MYWKKVLQEFLNKDVPKQDFLFTNFGELKKRQQGHKANFVQSNNNKRGRILKTYPLGNKYKDLYFTRREAECMVWMLEGKTLDLVAEILHLSPRTIEFYLKNIKTKLGCHTKRQAIELVRASNFLDNIDFLS